MNKPIAFFLCLFLLFLSCKTAKLSDAVTKQERGEYYDAAQIYRKVYTKTSPKKTWLRGSIAFHLGECYYKTGNAQRALIAYSNAMRYNYPDSSSILRSAQMMHKLGRYADAIKQYQTFLDSVPNNILAKNGITGCDSAIVWKQNPTLYAVKKMDKFNSRDGEFSPMLSGEKYDQIIITSSRKDATGDTKSGITGLKNNDFYLIKQDEKGQWMKPVKMDTTLNTIFDEGACSLSQDGSTLYYTYCGEEEGFPKTAEIRKSSRSGAAWSAGEKVEIFKDSLIMAAHPSVGKDGYLYFVSDFGGYGGTDIWRILISDIGTGNPENLGPEINTPGNEMFPYMRDDTTLYFSSDGHPGMGGLDIFKAKQNKAGKWEIENMKSPVNSMADDFGITFEGQKERGFFSSNRNDSRGADHIFSFERPTIQVSIEGWVLNKDEDLIDSAIVRIVGKDGTDLRVFPRKDDGTYTTEVARGMDYVMMGSAPGYLNQKQILSVPDEEKSDTFYVDFYLASITKPVLIDIFYDFNQATLRPESKKALDELIALLNDNPNVTIELSAHTDRIGSDEYNINLSQRRAQSVVDYLIKGGIDKDRLTAVGYGKSQPKEVTKKMAEKYDFLKEGQKLDADFVGTLTPEQQDIADQINRRTEFKVLRTNYRLF